MAQLTKAQLATQNATDFPNNNQGLITPAILRGFNTDMIDSLVDEVSYNIDSASFSASIAQLNNFSSSLDATFATDAQLTALSTSIAVTDLAQSQSIAALQSFSSSLDATFATDAQLSASVAALSSSVAVTDNTQSASIAALQQFSSSLDATFATDAQLTALSTSVAVTDSGQDTKINSLINATGSFVTEAESGSFVTSVLAGGTPNVISVTKGDGAINTITVNNVTSASFAFTASEARNVVLIARNQNASTLPAGTLVHIVDAVGDNPIFNTASFDTEALSANTLGMLRTPAASGADVEVLVNGILVGVNTDPVLGYVAGDILYLSSSGQFTRVQPQAPKQIVTIGQVLRAQQNNGSIYVNISNGWELDELHNVAINGVADGDLLVYRSGSGLWTNSSSLELGNATTGSNTFTGTQTMQNLVVNGTASFAYTQTVTGSAVIIGEEYIILNNQTPTAPYAGIKVFDSGSAGVTASLLWDGINDHWVYENVSGSSYGAAGFLSGPTGSSLSSITYPSANRLVKGGGSDHLYDSNISDNGSVVSSAVSVEVTGSVTANSGFIGNASTATSASFATTASFALNASSVDTSSLATTGSNSFVGNENITGSLLVRSGSIYSISNNTTINPDLYYSASTAGQVNIIRGWSDDPQPSGVLSNQANFTSSFRITGSNNIVSLPLQRATNIAGGTADMTGYISGSGNTLVSNLGGIYLNSGSQLFPKTIANTIAGGSNILMNFTTSSLGNPSVNNNIINAANFVINHPSGSVNLASVNFLLGGTITSSQAFVTNVRPNINQNINVGNITTLRHISSSINYTANIGNSVVTVENFMSSSGLTSGNSVAVTNNAFFGGAAGVFQSIFVSGSQSANSTRNIIDNLFGGRNNQITASLVSSSASNVVSNIVYGQTLIVNGNQGPSGGSAFFGRFNDTGSNLSSLADIVFAVGTGVTAGTRKTGLWIDSASLTTINGGLYVTQSQVTLQNSGGLALSVISGSVEVTSPQGTGYFYTNLPITSSNGRINGGLIAKDLIVSGTWGGSGSGSLSVEGRSEFTGSVFTSASVNGVVNPLTISSNTASLDCSKGNFFTLQLVSGSSTHINPTNIAAGQTISVRLNTTGSGTVTFPSTIKQASGSLYTPTTSTGVDILTLVTFDTSSIYLVNVKNLV